MGYIERNLMPGEKVVYQTKLHWIIFLWPILLFIVGIIVGSSAPEFGGLFILVAAVMGIASFINYSSSEFGVTNKRVIAKTGLIRRNSLEVFMNKVEGIQVNQGILGRVFGYGSIIITGTGGTKDPFHKISNPLEFRKKVQEQIANETA